MFTMIDSDIGTDKQQELPCILASPLCIQSESHCGSQWLVVIVNQGVLSMAAQSPRFMPNAMPTSAGVKPHGDEITLHKVIFDV